MKKILHFILITCLASWAVSSLLYLFNIETGSISYTIFGSFYMLIPAIVAVVLQKFVNKQPVRELFLPSFKINKWFLIALFTPLVLVFLSLGTSLLFPGVSFSWSAEGLFQSYEGVVPDDQIALMKTQFDSFHPLVFVLINVVSGLFAACTINGLFAFGEELGWRGYMLYHLRKWSFLKVSLFTGAIWGIWHFPLILRGHNYPDHPAVGVLMMIAFCVLLSPMMSYIVIKSKSVITAALFHGSINAFAGFTQIYLVGGNDLSTGITGYAGFISMLVVTMGFYLFDKYVTKENIFSVSIEKSIKTGS